MENPNIVQKYANQIKIRRPKTKTTGVNLIYLDLEL